MGLSKQQSGSPVANRASPIETLYLIWKSQNQSIPHHGFIRRNLLVAKIITSEPIGDGLNHLAQTCWSGCCCDICGSGHYCRWDRLWTNIQSGRGCCIWKTGRAICLYKIKLINEIISKIACCQPWIKESLPVKFQKTFTTELSQGLLSVYVAAKCSFISEHTKDVL